MVDTTFKTKGGHLQAGDYPLDSAMLFTDVVHPKIVSTSTIASSAENHIPLFSPLREQPQNNPTCSQNIQKESKVQANRLIVTPIKESFLEQLLNGYYDDLKHFYIQDLRKVFIYNINVLESQDVRLIYCLLGNMMMLSQKNCNKKFLLVG